MDERLMCVFKCSMYFCILDYNRSFKSSNEIHCHHYRPQRSCGKVIFSQVSVSHPVDRGCVYPSMHWGRHPPRRHLPRQTPRPGQTSPWADTLLEQTATAADGAHPTGMHSCSFILFVYLYIFSHRRIQDSP